MAKTTIYSNGRIATNATPYFVEAIAVSDGKTTSNGSSAELLRKHADATEAIVHGAPPRNSLNT
jgi:predicted amidohydrolase YtcJ